MSTPFPRVAGREVGYDARDVDAFLAEARRQYDGNGAAAKPLTAVAIRHASFDMHRGGYSPKPVDAALERLEDAFALRERDRAIAERGDAAWLAGANETVEALVSRLTRPAGERFTRVGRFGRGYDPDEVDRFTAKLARGLRDDGPITVDEVRTVAFVARRGGYAEAQVDLVLDAAIDALLALR